MMIKYLACVLILILYGCATSSGGTKEKEERPNCRHFFSCKVVDL